MIAISLCMIVKDEEVNLSRCLDSVANFVDEIIIVDTGSMDRTKEIALKYTDKVFDYLWNNSFADARNFSISKASNEYVLMIDSDELVESIDMCEMKILIQKNQKMVGRLQRVNEYSRNGISYHLSERVNRLFSKKYYKYEGSIHEQVVPIDEINMEMYQIPLKISHSGYEGDLAVRKKKTERNITLLILALQKEPEDPYLIYQLGKSYYMGEDYNNACNYFGQALSYNLDLRLEYVQDLIESYGYSLLNTAQYEKSMQLLNVYDELSKSADYIFLIALVLMNNGKFHEAIDEFLKASRQIECKMEGVNDYLAYYNIGVIFECLGDVDSAKKYYKMCGNYGLAFERIKAINK
ncbi:MAG: tetratricopeptide repeat-containing glycosyltransferase family 2 protein [Mobilitalea sp.]